MDSIPPAGLRVNLKESPEGFGVPFEDSGYVLSGPLRANLEFRATREGVHVTGRIKAPFTATCHRCLGEFPFSVDSDIDIFFSREEGRVGEVELSSHEMDLAVLEGETLDTREVIIARLAEEFPLKALCREDCRGLCQGCGADLNSGPCECVAEDKVDARLAALLNFRVRARGKDRLKKSK